MVAIIPGLAAGAAGVIGEVRAADGAARAAAAGVGAAVAVAPIIAALTVAYAANKILFSPMCDTASARYAELGCVKNWTFPCYPTMISIATYCGGESVTGLLGGAYAIDALVRTDWTKNNKNLEDLLRNIPK